MFRVFSEPNQDLGWFAHYQNMPHNHNQAPDDTSELCLPDQLDGRPRDFFEHPLLMIGGEDRWEQMTNTECDVPCYYAPNSEAYRLRCVAN
jgi:hypothetical protein